MKEVQKLNYPNIQIDFIAGFEREKTLPKMCIYPVCVYLVYEEDGPPSGQGPGWSCKRSLTKGTRGRAAGRTECTLTGWLTGPHLQATLWHHQSSTTVHRTGCGSKLLDNRQTFQCSRTLLIFIRKLIRTGPFLDN